MMFLRFAHRTMRSIKSESYHGGGMLSRWGSPDAYNNSASAINYASPSGTQSLNANSADIWIDGVLQAQNVLQDQNWGGGVTIDAVGFRSFSGDQQRLLVDDFRAYDEALVIPEPSTLMLVGLSLGTLAIFRRKK